MFYFHILKNKSTVISPMIRQRKCWEAVAGKTKFAARNTFVIRNIKEYWRPPVNCWV